MAEGGLKTEFATVVIKLFENYMLVSFSQANEGA